MSKKKSVFSFVQDIFLKKPDWDSFSESDKKEFNVYMINQIISMNPDYTGLINDLQEYTIGMDKKHVYNVYKNLFPKQKFYSKYIKGAKLKNRYSKDLIDFIVSLLECSKRDAVENLNMIYSGTISKNTLKEELKRYGKSDKDIKKIMKLKK